MRMLAVAVLLLLSAAAHAGDVDVMRQYNMLGKWAYVCGQPPSSTNPHETYAVQPNGDIQRTLEMKVTGLDGNFKIRSAQAGGPEQFTLTLDMRDGEVFTVTYRREGQRYRSMHSANQKGEVFVSDGKFRSGADTQWFTKCQ